MARRRSPRRRPRSLTPGLIALVLAVLAVVGLERAGYLPAPLAGLVREAETAVVDPLLAELGLPPLGRGNPGASVPPPDLSPDGTLDLATARQQLDTIRVEPERRTGYDRADFPHWLDLDGDCMDARHEVLAAESLTPPELAPNGCDVIAGRWFDPFTDETETDPGRLDVDHFVPLAEAYDSGASAWSQERRADFANDLSDPRSLIAVTAAANRSKSDNGPEDWLPPAPGYRCRYVADWIAVKARWDLAMDERERVTVGNLLTACAEAGGPPPS